VIISENGTASGAMDWAPYGYSVVTFGDDGKANEKAPLAAVG
jgi:hypothetical protein